MTTIIPVILSGGAGSRLWPVSRESHPKPFIKLPDGQSLLQKTFARACQFNDTKEIITITNKEYYLKSRAEYETAGISHSPAASFLLEPCARNTSAAILMAAFKINAAHGPEAIMLVLPADHLITPLTAFTKCCELAFQVAARGHLVTFGIKPDAPETGYGYIECGAAGQFDSYAIERFVEKPTPDIAKEYLASGRFLWNSGMFCFQAQTILVEFAKHAPALFQQAEQCWQQSRQSSRDPDAIDLNEAAFKQLQSISIDYAVMEKSSNIFVIPCELNWQDIGSWESYKNLFQSDQNGNTILGEAILIDSANNFIHSENRMVTSIGINNLAIIDTPDAMLITSRDRVQDVKDIVQSLKNRQHESYLTHRTVIRPWGTYTVLEEGPCFKIKRIEVKPGASLSLQKHHQRSEHWVVVEGTAKIINGDKEYTLQTNESTFVAMNTPHRLSNPTESTLIIIEVQTGSYLGEDDIVRMDDHYGRTAPAYS
ncbi:MAG TPA: mannose-1-phosphate guanylyltransferase/mannose-6-phosphate isomerase [Gammaproteobacteria bacterium]|nr:mannose-1-phosphate guanylyltransferase/mannose-6-phosphate isomerase [Gammaproteobacteria bacterium]